MFASSRRCLLFVLLAVALAACGKKTFDEEATQGSSLSQISLGNARQGGNLTDTTKALAVDHRAGALALYRKLAHPGANMVFSPLALQLALGMAYIGSRGETAAQLAAAMSWRQAPQPFAAAQALLLDTMASQQETLAASKQGLDVGQSAGVTPSLTTATRAFIDKHSTLAPDYSDALVATYSASAGSMDFRGSAEASRQEINAWVSDQTGGHIVDLLPPMSIVAETKLVLTAALRFADAWRSPMTRDVTPDLAFVAADHRAQSVPGLRVTDVFAFRDDDSVTTVELPYAAGYSMFLVKPKQGLAAFEATLDANALSLLILGPGAGQHLVQVHVPPLDIASTAADLSQILAGMGVKDLFSGAGQFDIFSPAAANDGLAVNTIVEQAHILMDEKGTQAEAAVAVGFSGTAAAPGTDVPEPQIFELDRPFIFMILDQLTRSIVFMGRVESLNP